MKMISNIVFTKNRPLQLHGYLESLYRFFSKEIIQTYILWKEELFTEQYQQLFSHYQECEVIKETEFSGDFFNILNLINTKYILFGIDDVIYFDSVDFDVIDKTFDTFNDIFGFSLRFGDNILKNGKDEITKIEVKGQQVYKLDWQNGWCENTRYPFELCATIYRTELIKNIINSSRNNNPLIVKFFSPASFIITGLKKIGLARKILKKFGYFYSPNTLESWNCRWCQQQWSQLPAYLYFQKICASAIQVNMVNTTTKNKDDYTEALTVETLNEKYKQGCRLNIDFTGRKKPAGTHCGDEFFGLIKK